MPNISTIGYIPNLNENVTGRGKSELGKIDFLNLLVTQLRYQNPMEPMKDSDFIAQLAQFSSLEQLSNINTSLGYSMELDYVLSQTIANTMATTIIGKEIVAEGNGIHHTYEAKETVHFNLAADAKDVKVKIYDEAGTLVRTIMVQNLEEGKNMVDWDGKDDSGSKLAGGDYTFEVEAKNSADESIDVSTRIVGIVNSVRYQDGRGFLVINGQMIEMSDILEVNLPSSSEDGGSDKEDSPYWN